MTMSSKSVLSIPKWQHFERGFESSFSYSDPLQDVELVGEFTSPSGKVYKLPAFWDGDSTWRIRFSPNEEGRWTYTARGIDSNDPGFLEPNGSFICSEPRGATRFGRHGPICLSEDRHFLVHADGTPFFWLADTARNGPLRSTDAEWESYLNVRKRQNFTVIQWVATQWIGAPNGDRSGALPFIGKDRIAINPKFFQRLDKRIEAMNRNGLLSAPVLLWAAEWGDPSVMSSNPGLTLPEEQAILLARYMVARWGTYFVVWILNGDGNYEESKAERWRRIGRAVFGASLHAPVCLHPQEMSWILTEFRNETWLDILGYQSGHSGSREMWDWIVAGPPAKDWTEQPFRPFINLEPVFEHIAEEAGVGYRVFDEHVVRKALYMSLFNAPIAGVSYGGHGVWGWDDGVSPTVGHASSFVPLQWQKALRMPAAEQMAFLARLFESIEWWRLKPSLELVASPRWKEKPQLAVKAIQTDAGELGLVYVPEQREVELCLDRLQSGLSVFWFNPRNGDRIRATFSGRRSRAQFTTPGPSDWILIFSNRELEAT
jgi:hypothetical protein